jgi:peptide-methionine (S)-S-oxide reductase
MQETAIFGAGCFWGVEAEFRKIEGVLETEVGYSGGTKDQPTYHEVCTGKTGHAEVLRVEYDPQTVKYEKLLKVFFSIHDPTTLNRQGPDHGTQYRSVIFYTSEEQRAAAEKTKQAEAPKHHRSVVTAIEPARTFWPAEEYHQRYLEKRGEGATCHLA